MLLPFTAIGQPCAGTSIRVGINGSDISPTVCEGASFPVALGRNYTGYINPIFQWQERVGTETAFHDIFNVELGRPVTSAVRGGYSYRLKVSESDGSCPIISEPININVIPAPVVSAGPDVSTQEGKSVRLDANASGNDLTYLWSPALYLDDPTSLTPMASPPEDMFYTLRVTDPCGNSVTDEVFIKVLKGLDIPGTFTPNGDGVNDFWNIRGLISYPEATISVFNRYGDVIFSSQGYDVPWDGTHNGQYLSESVYYYLIDLKSDARVYSGSLTILK